ADPGMVTAYKALIDDGFALSLGEGLALEQRRSATRNAAVDAAEVEQRRHAVVARGRAQQTPSAG
ncbi:MAG: hypothetical protein J0M19_16710, partial [Sphingomonadales bacterium]|nr:hypothetical protein [Sphingomonadales bacterium]